MKLGPEAPTNPKARCLNCGKVLDGCTIIDEDQNSGPQEGDASFCVYCGHAMIFNADRTLRQPTPEEWREISQDERFIAAAQAISASMGSRKN